MKFAILKFAFKLNIDIMIHFWISWTHIMFIIIDA